MVQGVFSTEADPGPNFAYTVGLTEAGLPELVITGLPHHDLAAELLNTAARLHLADEIRAGREVTEAATVALRAVDAPGTIAGPAFALYGRRVRFVQLVWPDQGGAYPGDDGWALGDAQPLFTEPLPPEDRPDHDGLVAAIDADSRG
jgi:hypothetical protein